MIDRPEFPVTLIFPPQGHFTQPYLALPCLKAWLVRHGFGDVELIDANIEAYDRFLSGKVLARAAERVAERLPLERFAGMEELPFGELEAYRAAVESAVSADSLVESIDGAKAVLRGEAAFDHGRYKAAVRAVYHGLRLFSAAHFPSRLTPHNFTMGYGIDRSAEVLAATRDEVQNPFLAHFRETLLPRLVARRPRVLGLSVIYGSQLVPALTLGRLVQQALPDCHVTAGGGFLAYIGEKLMAAEGVAECLDSLIFYEGEAPLLELCETLRDGGSLGRVGSLAWFERSGEAPRAVVNARGHPIHLDSAPAPDFEGLPFERYLSPELVLPIDINRGCYYGECVFCTLPTVIGPGFRTRSAELIVDHVLELEQRHGAGRYTFVTDCMPPDMIRELPRELIARKAGIRWWADARVEPSAYTAGGARTLYESGCRKLLFGFESASHRVLKLMRKGVSPKAVSQVAHNCAEAGISVTLYAVVGFPTETREEARTTLDFLIEHKDVAREVSLQTFHVDEVAPIYQTPEPFDIEILDDPSADLQLYHDYRAKSGMTAAEAAEMFEEMMAGLRREYRLFSGDNIFYFMQKSHYFLHLARDVSPEDFLERAEAERARRLARGAAQELAPARDLRLVELPFPYGEVRRRLAHPLARAIRPDFLTGRFVEGALDQARAALTPVGRAKRVLAYSGLDAEFAELRPDGARLLGALSEAGDLGRLLEGVDSAPARQRVEDFAAHLHRLGLLAPSEALAASS